MSISSHTGIVILVIAGVVTILGVIIIAAVEARRMDKGRPPIIKDKEQVFDDKKKN